MIVMKKDYTKVKFCIVRFIGRNGISYFGITS